MLLIDATALLFRAHHTTGDLRTSTGAPTGAMLGTLNILRRLLREENITDFGGGVEGAENAPRVSAVFDAAGKNFRHELLPTYKANRPPPDTDLIKQIAPLKEFLAAWGLPVVSVAGVEADDVIATLAAQAAAAGEKVRIAAADKDLMQLVDDNIIMVDGMRGAIFDAAGVEKKFGVPPAWMVDYLSLVGDSSDNIAGVAKVGAKTAAKWLNEYGGMDGLLKRASTLGGVAGENFREAHRQKALDLNRKLITLKRDVALPEDWRELKLRAPDAEKWRALCAEYEFRHLEKMADAWDGGAAGDASGDVEVVDKMPRASGSAGVERAKVRVITEAAELKKWLAAAGELLAVDVETDTLAMMEARLVGFSLAADAREAVYIPLAHKSGAQMKTEDALAAVGPVLEDARVVKIAHNAKFDRHVFANHNIHWRGRVEDTQIAAYALYPGGGVGLDALAAQHLGIETIRYSAVVDGKKIKVFSEVAVEDAAAYAAEDAEVAWKLWRLFSAALKKDGGDEWKPRAVYEEMDRPLAAIVLKMERAGVRVDVERLNKLSAGFAEQMAQLEEKAHAQAGGAFNLNSPRQLGQVLFERLKIPPLKKTGKGAPSTAEGTLMRLAADHPLAQTVLDFRHAAKLRSTYADKLPRMVSEKTGRIHSNFNQCAVITGRLASAAPNLQNIPIKGEDGRRIRRAFVAAEGAVMICADYSQIELRLIAHMAEDEAMLAAFAAGGDIHKSTAAEVFNGGDEAAVTDEQRRSAKAINFGLIYGMSAFGLARGLGTDIATAQNYIERYFARFSGIAAYMKRTQRQGRAEGAVHTIFGRRIPIRAEGRGEAARRAERAAINAPVQGSAADLIKKAMRRADVFLTNEKMYSRLLLQVHDELVFEAPENEAEKLKAALPALMGGAAKLRAPLAVNIGVGANWDEAH